MATATAEAVMTGWSIEDSEQLYRVPGWGDPYFSINSAGHLTVSPQGDRGGTLDLYEMVQALRQRSLNLPLLIRFPDILEDRIDRLNSAFRKAIGRYNYKGTYRGVFPVKCNQQRHLVEPGRDQRSFPARLQQLRQSRSPSVVQGRIV